MRGTTVYLRVSRLSLVVAALALLIGCSDDDGGSASSPSIYSFANGCFSVADASSSQFLARRASGFELAATATPFFMKPSGLGRYLLFDDAEGYLVSDGQSLLRETELLSDIKLVDDSFESDAEWELQAADGGPGFLLRHRKSGGYLADAGLVARADQALTVELAASAGCAEFPEESTHSEGEVAPPAFEDGSLYGVVDTHSHIFANFGFGGGGVFHGAPYHSLGVEHALLSCEQFHGVDGKKDFFGAGFDAGRDFEISDFIGAIATGELEEFNHSTDGWPEFTTWPSAFDSSTHQTQYYKWLQRAHLAGLRLVVQHAVSNKVLCDFLGRGGIQPIRYSCNDMVAVDRQIDEVYAMQEYIDAQEGGPGRGWFRVVTSPAQAREVIAGGKMAVILGIETSHLFDCFLTPPVGFRRCTEQDVLERLQDYHDRGVRVLFPVHKYDNGFSAGDGDKAFIEIGNVLQSSNFLNFTTDCDLSVPTVFDRRPANFPGLIELRDDYFATPPNDFSEFFIDPLGTLAPFLDRFLEPGDPEVENHCQATGLTDLGEFLVRQMMARGMILEIDHFPRLAYKRVFEIMEENDYPAAGTHGLDNDGRLYALGGISKTGFGRCRAEGQQSTVDNGFQDRVTKIAENGGFPAIGFGFDLNGFAGAPGPRFGPKSGCSAQSDPVTYPFTSFAGDVTFLQPQVGNRTIDFNTEGLVHIGLLPELIEDVRGDGVTDEELEPLFKSAEGYIRMWEKAESRGQELSAAAE